MLTLPNSKRFFYLSLTAHLLILAIFIFSFDWQSTQPVIENTNEHDVISAVILGDTAKSRILPKKSVKEVKAQPVVAQSDVKPIEKDAISLAKKPKKMDNTMKNAFAKDLLKQDLLKDVQKIKDKTLKKSLAEQNEKTMRQALLDEDIKLSTDKARNSQGIVNKYQALILQAISEAWNVPPEADQNKHCTLLIRLAPNGTVLAVEISKASGSSELDRSAKAAVYKASPLPVPKKADDFEPFREFLLDVSPKDVENH